MTETKTEDGIWYLARDGKQHGPLSHVEMTKLVQLGHLRPTDLVWRPGFADWRPAPTVFDMTPPPAAAPPPAPKAEPAPSPAPVIVAPKAQPSLAEMSMTPQPAATAPARFEFPEPQPAATTTANASDPRPVARDPRPMTFDTGAFRPATAEPQIGAAPSAPEPALEPFRMEPMFEDPPPAKQGRGIAVALGLLVAIGGVSAAGYMYRDTLKTMLQGAATVSPADIPVVTAPATTTSGAPQASDETATAAAPAAEPAPPAPLPASAEAAPQPAAVVAAAEPQPPPAQQLPGVPVTADPNPIDASLQASPFWTYAKSEFPQWYADRVTEIGTMKAANEPDANIDRKLVEQIVVLRRQNASKALAASPERLTEIAEAYVANLGDMQSRSVDTCYEFIEKSEMTPAATSLVQKPSEGGPLHAQMRAVFAAVVEGRKNPVTRAAPMPDDYALLAKELGTLGWTQADIQLFADPNALAASPRDRVCKMVKDWFSAHLAVKELPARERLLHETLRPVIAN